MRSWVTYGLGSERDELPAFVLMSTGSGISGGSENSSSGFLPGVCTGTRRRNTDPPILNVDLPPGADGWLAAGAVKLVSTMNRRRLTSDGDPEIAARIAAYEMAHRLQSSAPELVDLGLDNERLTYRSQGRDFRLTDVHGHVVNGLVTGDRRPGGPSGAPPPAWALSSQFSPLPQIRPFFPGCSKRKSKNRFLIPGQPREPVSLSRSLTA